MRLRDENEQVSIRYTVTLEDGTLLSHQAGGDLLAFTRGQDQILPALEEALRGAARGEKRRLVLSPEPDPNLRLDASRLALLLGHPGETLILTAEIL